MVLNAQQEQLCKDSRWDFSDLKALFLNCTLKKSPERSHTQGLIDISTAIMEKLGLKQLRLALPWCDSNLLILT